VTSHFGLSFLSVLNYLI